jgi:hypothetical protein
MAALADQIRKATTGESGEPFHPDENERTDAQVATIRLLLGADGRGADFNPLTEGRLQADGSVLLYLHRPVEGKHVATIWPDGTDRLA